MLEPSTATIIGAIIAAVIAVLVAVFNKSDYRPFSKTGGEKFSFSGSLSPVCSVNGSNTFPYDASIALDNEVSGTLSVDGTTASLEGTFTMKRSGLAVQGTLSGSGTCFRRVAYLSYTAKSASDPNQSWAGTCAIQLSITGPLAAHFIMESHVVHGTLTLLHGKLSR